MSARPAHFSAGQLALELPVELPAIELLPEWKDQQRLWGHAFHPMCSYLASFPAALTHAFIARYSRPGDVVLDPFSGRGTTPLQACAEGRIGVGNDLNPFAHLLTAAKVEPATPCAGDDPPGPASPRLERELRGLAGPGRGRRGRSGLRGRARAGRRVRPAAGRRLRARPGRGRDGVPSADPRPAPVRPDRSPAGRPDGPLPGRRPDRDPPRQERELPVRAHAEHLLDGAALRPRLRRPHRVRVARARRLRRPGQEARPAVPAAAAVDRGDRAPRRCPRSRAARPGVAARPEPARARAPRGDLAAVPARRQVRLLQLAADVAARVRLAGDRRGARRCPPPRAVPAVPPRRAGRSPPGPGRRRRRRPRHRRRRDGPRPPHPGRGRPRGPGLGVRRRARRLPAGRGRAGRRGGEPQDDQAVGRRGRPARPRPIGSSSSARPRPAAAGRSPRPLSTSTGPGRRGRCAPSRMPPCSRCTTRRTWPRWIRSSC